jgi:hypothetical protein
LTILAADMPQHTASRSRRLPWLTGSLLAIVVIAAGTYVITVQLTAVRQSSVAACLNETFQSSRQQSLPLSWSAAKLPLPQLETKLNITTALPSDLRMFSIAAAMCCSEMQRDFERCTNALRAFVDAHPDAKAYVSNNTIRPLAVAEVEKKSGPEAAQKVAAKIAAVDERANTGPVETSVSAAKDEHADDSPNGATNLGPLDSSPQIIRGSVGKISSNDDAQDLVSFTLVSNGVLTIGVVPSNHPLNVDLYRAGPTWNPSKPFFGFDAPAGGADAQRSLAKGRYLVRLTVQVWNRPLTSYTLTLLTIPAKVTESDPEPGGSPDDALDLGVLGGTVKTVGGIVDHALDPRDFYRFEVARQGNLTLGLTAFDANTHLRLYRQIPVFDDSKATMSLDAHDGHSASETLQVLPGIYFAAVVTSYESSNYRLDLAHSVEADALDPVEQ